MTTRNVIAAASAWNFIGLFFGALLINTLITVVLLLFGVLENWGFEFPSGKSNNTPDNDVVVTRTFCVILILCNLFFVARLGYRSRSSKFLGYVAGALLPLGLVGYWLFTNEAPW
jgi:hypothetical protein